MKRAFDSILATFLLLIFFSPLLLLALLVVVTSKGPALYWSRRIGKNNVIFKMPKLRSMVIDAPTLATHLLITPDAFFTPIGGFLRRYSLDELPQLISVLKGDMSLIGPRPALCNQDDLIKLRTDNGVNKLLPGITGWAQVNGRDELLISGKVELDVEYMNRQSFWFDIKILWMTFVKVIKKESVSH